MTPTRLNSLDDLSIEAGVIETGETKTLVNAGYHPRYVPTSDRSGHLVYVQNGTLFGVAFDLERLEIRGTPVPLVSGVGDPNLLTGGGQYTVSNTGTLAYVSAQSVEALYPIQWMGTSGQMTTLLAQPATYVAPRLSPDGSQLAFTLAGSKGGDVWVYDLQGDAPVQLTFDGAGVREVAWAPDSKHLVFGDGTSLWWTRADGSGQPQRILEKASNPRPFSISPYGQVAYTAFGAQGLPDLSVIRLDLSDLERPKATPPELFLGDPIVEVDPSFSPDGKFIAYASTELGPNEVFVRPYPGPGGKWKVFCCRRQVSGVVSHVETVVLSRRRRSHHGGEPHHRRQFVRRGPAACLVPNADSPRWRATEFRHVCRRHARGSLPAAATGPERGLAPRYVPLATKFGGELLKAGPSLVAATVRDHRLWVAQPVDVAKRIASDAMMSACLPTTTDPMPPATARHRR
jgi:hypothetical protein